jgi:hypothetical protein
MTTREQWVCVQDAARQSGVPSRTLYAWVKNKRLTSKHVGGLLQVQLDEVVAVTKGTPTLGSAAPIVQAAATVSPTVALARDDLETAKLHTERLKAEAAALRARDELAQVEAERISRRKLLEVELERQRSALMREQQEYQGAAAEAQARQDAAQRQRIADAEKLRRQRERDAAERDALQLREQWQQDWLRSATQWIVEQGLPELAGAILPVVRETLQGFQPIDPDQLVGRTIRHDLWTEFAPEFSAVRDARLAQRRVLAIDEASRIALHEEVAIQAAVTQTAAEAAQLVDPGSVEGRDFVMEAARRELRRLRSNHLRRQHDGRDGTPASRAHCLDGTTGARTRGEHDEGRGSGKRSSRRDRSGLGRD